MTARPRRAADDPARAERALRVALHAVLDDALAPVAGRRRRRRGGARDGARDGGVSAHDWLRAPGVQGIGIAHPVRGARRGRDLALVVCVDEKRDAAALVHPVPPVVAVAGVPRAVPTDVVAIGALRLQDAVVFPGTAVAAGTAAPGTLGCVVARADDPHGRYLLSCAHVLAPIGADPGDAIVVPPRATGDVPRTIARLADATVTAARADAALDADAAIALLDDPDLVTEFISELGAPTAIADAVVRGMQVRKSGAATGVTHGVVEDVDFAAIVDFPVAGGGTRPVAFRDLVRCPQFTLGGDSGAAVLDERRRLVGIHMMGSARASVFCRAARACTALGITLPP